MTNLQTVLNNLDETNIIFLLSIIYKIVKGIIKYSYIDNSICKYTNRGNKYFEIKLFLTFTRDDAVKLLYVVLFFSAVKGMSKLHLFLPRF